MRRRRAILKVTNGPNENDTLNIDFGCCRLIGRHLSEQETSFIDVEGRSSGHRALDAEETAILTKHLKEKAPVTNEDPEFSLNAFERGPDIILADESISRAHAMIFFDEAGVGIIDLASTNGTFINHERVGSARLADGDHLTIGSCEMGVAIHT